MSGWASTSLLASPGLPSMISQGPAACPMVPMLQLPSLGRLSSPVPPATIPRPSWPAATATWTLMTLRCQSCQKRACSPPLRGQVLLPRQLPQASHVVSGNASYCLRTVGHALLPGLAVLLIMRMQHQCDLLKEQLHSVPLSTLAMNLGDSRGKPKAATTL